jgi:hypothetical protein
MEVDTRWIRYDHAYSESKLLVSSRKHALSTKRTSNGPHCPLAANSARVKLHKAIIANDEHVYWSRGKGLINAN